ncbi:DUF2690 domain-containing protein [Dactylosporangium sp. NPDC051484]|uniref:DUF2690 domain-containing protein n=1 Tax=Dactylosporangium sp. NPDC051484 TaxID=3154942 RepID=UPI003450E3A4
MHTRTRIIGLFGAALLALSGVVAAGTPAQALTVGCWGDYCSGRDPEETGCSADGVTVASGPMWGTFNTYVELRWSPTCKTNWARLPAVWGTSQPQALVAYQCPTGYQQVGVSASNSTWSWSRMIYSPTKSVRAIWNGGPGGGATACV